MWRRGLADALGEAGYDVTAIDDPNEWQPGRHGSGLVMAVTDDSEWESVEVFSEEHPYTPVVAAVSDLTLTKLAHGLRHGAAGVVDVNWEIESIVAVLSAAFAEMALIPCRMAAAMAQLVPVDSSAAALVTEEQVGWLRAMAGGQTVADIAEAVGYSERAMFRNLKETYLRIGVKNRTEALIWASRNGVLAAGSEAE